MFRIVCALSTNYRLPGRQINKKLGDETRRPFQRLKFVSIVTNMTNRMYIEKTIIIIIMLFTKEKKIKKKDKKLKS